MPAIELVVASYHPALVVASFLVSMLGAFVALGAAAGIRSGVRSISRFNLCAAALSLGGVGIWCMHFIGMVAFRIPVRQGYAVLETVVSFVAAVVVSGLAFRYLASRSFSIRRLLVAGPLAGLAVALMHYLGMSGIRFPGYVDWNLALVALSVFIAVAAATAALWLAFHTRRLAHRVLASGVMATAVCTMHYTGMAAASFYCRTGSNEALPSGTLSVPYLAEAVFAIALLLCGVLLLDELMRRNFDPEQVVTVAPSTSF